MRIFLYTFALVLVFSSCKKEKSTTTPGNTNAFFLKKDGTAFTPGYLEISDPFQYAVSVAAAASSQSNANTYSFLIDKAIAVGTYDYETMVDEYNCWFSYTGPNFDLYAIRDGSFEIVQQDTTEKILEMKFQFELENENGQTHQITNGRFKVHY